MTANVKHWFFLLALVIFQNKTELNHQTRDYSFLQNQAIPIKIYVKLKKKIDSVLPVAGKRRLTLPVTDHEVLATLNFSSVQL